MQLTQQLRVGRHLVSLVLWSTWRLRMDSSSSREKTAYNTSATRPFFGANNAAKSTLVVYIDTSHTGEMFGHYEWARTVDRLSSFSVRRTDGGTVLHPVANMLTGFESIQDNETSSG